MAGATGTREREATRTDVHAEQVPVEVEPAGHGVAEGEREGRPNTEVCDGGDRWCTTQSKNPNFRYRRESENDWLVICMVPPRTQAAGTDSPRPHQHEDGTQRKMAMSEKGASFAASPFFHSATVRHPRQTTFLSSSPPPTFARHASMSRPV